MYIILIFILSCLLGWVIWRRLCPVSYTHLDVYKRQELL